MIDVTVIVPVYNVEAYLERCVNFLANQKCKIEVLLIDDCSKDNSLEVAKRLEKKYNFVRVISLQNNKGVSNARNVGIKEAKGKYLMFCDGDDWYEAGAVDMFLNIAKENNSDFVMANYFLSYENGKKIKTDSLFKDGKILTKEEIISYLPISSCSKLMKRKIFIEKNIYYSEKLKRCEEISVIPIVALYAEKPIAINKYLYNYYQRNSSASNTAVLDLSFFEKSFEMFIKNMPNNYKEEYVEEIEFRAIEHVLYGNVLLKLKNENKKEVLKYIDEFKSKYPEFIQNKYLINYNFKKVLFLKAINKKRYLLMKIYAIIHSIMTG